jgi:hypothetical protein
MGGNGVAFANGKGLPADWGQAPEAGRRGWLCFGKEMIG